MNAIRLTPVVKALLLIQVAVFIIQQTSDQFFGTHLSTIFGLVPIAFANHFYFWQIITYSFLHADVLHILFNGMMLAFIGSDLEALWGPKGFLRYYFFCVVGAGLLYVGVQGFLTIMDVKSATGGAGVVPGVYMPMVGASGGLYGLLMAYGIFFSERQLMFFMLFPMKAKQFVWILAGIEFITCIYSTRGEALSSVAHLGGLIAGFAYLIVWARFKAARRTGGFSLFGKAKKSTPKPNFKSTSSPQKRSHLKLIVNKSDFDDEDDSTNSGRGDPNTWH